MIKLFTIGIAIGAIIVQTLLPAPLEEPPHLPAPLPEPLPLYETVEPPLEPIPKPILKAEPEPVPDGVICTSDCPLIEVQEEVEQYFEDEPILIEIARCESRFRQWDETGEVLKNQQGSSATGVMQLMASYHEEPARNLGWDINDLRGNLAYAKHLYEEQGTKPWEASRYCWGSAMVAVTKGISDV